MKTIVKISSILLVLVSMVSCSTVKVSDAWKDSRIQNIDGGKVIIVFKSKDNVARQRFEKDMAAQFKAKGPEFEVLPSYVNFPDAAPDEKHTPEEVNQIREKLNEMGVDIAIVTTVKSVKESVVTNVTEDPSAYPYYGYGGYGGYGYYSGRYRTGYYHNMNMGYVGGGSSTAITSTEKEFVVETLLYDLSLPESEQLLAVVTSLVDNPKSLVTTSDDFAKAVVKQLFKK
ncbi:hypothetical protein [Flavicella sp.]|uniref:hypothetical protein n=1 Tax=Flavicella sp. TaxID=2957742 RepID=UPI002619E087|nr:hypothetical protein [Flavicella sp.]MDG1804959.1 hypothetical protein [Flavicella sp.]